MNWTKYIEHAKQHNVSVEVKEFKSSFFKGIDGYNKLLLSSKFYRVFDEYEYMLIYQTDAFVFRDDLDHWCSLGYDYIGAPWFQGWGIPTPDGKIIGVGNGGFSLRRINSVLKGLQSITYSDFRKYINGRRNLVKSLVKQPFYWFLSLFGENVLYYHSTILFEDRVISDVIAVKNKDFKIPPAEEALQFSFEVNPRKLYEMNNYNLPMGCHAWLRYDPEFWKPHIKSFGYAL
jgi:hypothetical protein